MKSQTKLKILGRGFDIMFAWLLITIFAMSFYAMEWLGVVIMLVTMLATYGLYVSYQVTKTRVHKEMFEKLVKDALGDLFVSLASKPDSHQREHADGSPPLH